MVDLGKNGLLALQEPSHLLHRSGLAVEGGPAEILGKADVKEQLVVKIVVVGHIIHEIADLLVAHPGEVGVPLGAGHVVKAEHGVVIIPCAVPHGAPQHIKEGAHVVLSALLVHHVDHVVHFLEADAGEHPGHISDHCHGKNLPFLVLHYHITQAAKIQCIFLMSAKSRTVFSIPRRSARRNSSVR